MPRCATSTKDATTADCVHVRRTTAVHCAHKAVRFPTAAIPLGPLEGLIAAVIPIAVSFIYPYSGGGGGGDDAAAAAASAFMSAAAVEQAMGHLLGFYPPLSGRLVLLPNGDREVDRLDSGALFVEATCDKSLQELHETGTGGNSKSSDHGIAARFHGVLSMFDLPAGSNALFAPFKPAAEHITRDPLFTIQHTRFACGSVALGVRIAHALTDAQGFFLVVQHLMELHGKLRAGETCPTLQKPPQWRSYLSTFRAEATPAETAEALAYRPEGLYVEEAATDAATVVAADDAVSPPPEVVGRELYFSAAQLEDLKRRATPPDGQGWVSTFEGLSALLWQCVYKARCATAAHGGDVTPVWPATDFLTSVNLRDRFVASADGDAASYFPVGCLAPVTTVPPAMLHDGPPCALAAAVHAMLHAPQLSPAEVRRTVRWMAAQPDRTRIRSRFHPSGFMISAWNKFDLYSASACEGVQPILVSTPFTCISLVDALGYILPCPPAFPTDVPPARTADGKGDSAAAVAAHDGVVIYLAADASVWTALRSDELLGKYVH